MIGEAGLPDISRLVDLGRELHGRAALPGGFLPGKFADSLRLFVSTPGLMLFSSDDGMLAAELVESPYSDDRIAVERWLIARDGQGRGLLSAFEAWGSDNGATVLAVTAQQEARGDAVVKMYARRGYQVREIAMTRAV